MGCWTHARRKFDEALKALPAEKRDVDVAAKQGFNFCNRLFTIERQLKEVAPEERYQARLERSLPVMDAFHAWLIQQRPKVLPSFLY